ncbi:threonine aldolase family protein [Burkholderia sp. JPY481]
MIDLYSDTKSKPTAGMRAAMASAVVGDEQADEDPTTLALCSRVASLLGYEAAIFMPSGTMCNLVATLVHTRPGDELIADAAAHICATEGAGASAIAGVAVAPLATRDGVFSPAQCRAAIRAPSRTAPRSAMVSIEQTTNFSGGAVWPLDTLRGVRDVALEARLKCHIDGARLLNASATTGIAPDEYASGWHSAWIDFSKGLGCPVGAVLCGNGDFIRQAWTWKYRLGGAMRQSGVLAAAALYALDNHVSRLVEDHANAVLIADILAHSPHFGVDTNPPRSNILLFRTQNMRIDARAFSDQVLARGVRVRVLDDGRIRVTTHLDVTRESSQYAADTLVSVANEWSL